ncbi:DUF4440 domain-containing protein [Kribbella sp. DT2]|uniref:DUF4440 domain-containing protein n=1 Tax=Kribbella sp. DT2 TaxID=3393427 RepID=UPI003CF76448
MGTDTEQIEGIVRAFFAAFTSGDGVAERLGTLRDLLLPSALIVKTCGAEPVAYGVEDFIAPRQELLTGGRLTDFREWAEDGRTEIFGDIAHWFGAYGKSGVQDDVPFTGRGMKTVQFVRTTAGWRISSAAWDDEREGLTIGG